MILVRDGRAEERHDAVAGVLVHRPFETVHARGEELEEAIEDVVPVLGIDLLGELHRALHVREEHGHLLALTLERAAGPEDLLGEVRWGVGLGGRPRRLAAQRRRTLIAEARAGFVVGAARWATSGERRGASIAESRPSGVLVAARGTDHGDTPDPARRVMCMRRSPGRP